MNKWFLGGVLALLLAGTVAAETKPFAELWNNIAHYDTNVERKGFSSLLGRFEGKIGLTLLDSPFQLYGAYYCTAAQSTDYWDNPLYYGAGIRFKPLAGYQGGWYVEWLRDVKIFYESLNSNYLKDTASAEAANLAKTDSRYGLDVWHEWNLDKPDESAPWGEMWLNLSNRQTNFGWEPFNSYVLYFQPKVGRHLGHGVEAYLRLDAVTSGKDGPAYSFLNVADYGVGLRFEPWRSAYKTDEDSLLKKFKMFAEVLGVSYLKDKPADPQKTVASDVRFGIDFSYGR
jgi:hypothetical protein